MASTYLEYAPPDELRGVVACLWEQGGGVGDQLVVPDGCIDLIWLAEGELVVAGPDTGPRTVELSAAGTSSGVRLRPGAAGAFLGRPAADLVDHQAAAVDVLGPDVARLADRLAGASAPHRLQLLAAAARARGISADPLVVAAADLLAAPGARVSAVAAAIGVSERQLHRRTLTAVGYAPKVLARVLRLHRLGSATGPTQTTMADRAFAAGYASQAHMADEVRALTGLTASQYLVRFVEDPAPAQI